MLNTENIIRILKTEIKACEERCEIYKDGNCHALWALDNERKRAYTDLLDKILIEG